jgi:hypothetical protein
MTPSVLTTPAGRRRMVVATTTMDDPTRHTPEHQPLTAEDLRVLDAYGEAFLTEATRRIQQWEMRGGEVDLTSFEFQREVLDRAFPERAVEATRGSKALALGKTIDVYWALMRGERVPWNVLDFFQAERFGLKRRHADGRYGLDDFNDVPRPGGST